MIKVSTFIPNALLIMMHFKTGALNEPFKHEGQKCLLDYILSAQNDAKYIFRNLLVISLDLFNALDYFAQKRLVHRDVKRMEMWKMIHSVIICLLLCRFKHPVNINMSLFFSYCVHML